jgi:hypothetical protein
VSKGGFTGALVPSLYAGIDSHSGINVVVLTNLIDPANPTNTAGPATGLLVSNKACTKLQSTWAGCTTTNAEATINIPLRCRIIVEAFRTAADETPSGKQEFDFEPTAASFPDFPALDPITNRLTIVSEPQELVFDKLPTASKFRVTAQLLGSLEEAIPFKLGSDILNELTNLVGKTGVAMVSDDWSYKSFEQGAKECKP